MDVFGGAPRFLAYPRTFVVPSGADAVLKCQISGDPRPTVIWERGTTLINPMGRYQVLEDGIIYSLIISQVTVADSGQYICKAKNSIGETYAAATLKVEQVNGDDGGFAGEDNQPLFLINPLSVKVSRGDNVAFNCKISGKPRPVVVWEKDGKKLNEIFESTHFAVGYEDGNWYYLKIFSSRPPDGGVYICRARNNFGETVAAAVLLVDAVARGQRDEMANGPSRNCYSPTRLDSHLPIHKWHGHHYEKRHKHRHRHHLEHDHWNVHQNGEVIQPTKAKVFSVNEGKHAKFRCYVTGKPKPEIIWKKDGKVITSGRRHLLYEDREGYFTLKVLYCRQQDNGLYVCAASNTAGQTLSAVQLNVKEPTIGFLTSLQDMEVNEKEQAVLECEVPLESIPATWYLEDRKLQPSTKYSMEELGTLRRLTIRDISMDDDGVYLCEMKDGGRSVAELAVRGRIVKRLPRKLDVLEGENAAFCVETEEEEVEGLWYKDGHELKETPRTILKSFGKTHILVFVSVTPEDCGFITFAIEDSRTSSQLRVKSAKHCPPSAPLGVRMTSEKANAALLTWYPAPDSRRNPATGYIIERQEVGTEEWVQCLTTDSASTVEILGDSVPAEADYKFRIFSANKYGKSGQVEFPGVAHLIPVARILTLLKGVQVMEGEGAEFVIELSASLLGSWFVNGAPLQQNERFTARHARSQHSLFIGSAQLKDSGTEISFVAHGVKDSAILHVHLPPVRITKLSEDSYQKFVMPSDTIVLYCEVSRPSAPVCWLKDGKEVVPSEGVMIQSEANMRRLVIYSAKLSDSGEYVCDASDDALTFSVNVAEPPVQILNIYDGTHYDHQSYERIVLTCQLSRASAEVRWYKDGLEVEESERVSIESDGIYRRLIIHSARLEDSGEYSCDAVDDSIFYDVKVTDLPAKIVRPSNSFVELRFLTSERVVLRCELSRPNAEVRWFKDGLEVEVTELLRTEADGVIRRLVIPNPSLEDSGEYICDTTDDSVTFDVIVSEPPVSLICPNKAPMLKIFRGDPITLECEASRANAEVKWFKNDVEVEEGEGLAVEEEGVYRRLVVRSAKLEHTGKYICDASDDYVEFNVQVSEAPVKILCLADLRTDYRCSTGDDVVLECELSRADGTVKWYKDGEKIVDNDRVCLEEEGAFRSLVILNAEAKDSGEYLCVSKNDSIIFHVYVEEPPVSITGNTETPEHHSLVASDDLVLACEVSRSNASVKWYKDGVELVPDERVCVEERGLVRQLVIHGVQSCDSGEYVCDALDDKMVTTVTVEEPPVRILNKEDGKDPIEVLEGESVVLTALVSRANASIQWLKNWRNVSSMSRCYTNSEGTSRTLTLKQLELTDSGVFTCDAQDDEMHFTLQVKEAPLRFANKRDCPEEVCVTETENAVLMAVLTKEKGEVKWYRHQNQVFNGQGKYELRQEGRVHSLMVQNVAREDAGMYNCVTQDDQLLFDVSVKELALRFVSGMSDVRAQKDETVTLRCELCKARGDVMWRKDGEEIQPSRRRVIKAEGRERSLTVVKVGVDDMGEYACESKDDRTVAHLTVEIPRVVEFISELHNVAVLEGEDASFKCVVSSDDVILTWHWKGTEIPVGDKFLILRNGLCHTLVIRSCQISDSGKVTADAEGVISKANLQVQEAQVVFTKKLQNVTAEEKEDVTLEAEVSAESGEVQWMKQGVVIQQGAKFELQESGRTCRLLIRNLEFADRGNYRCETLHDKTQARLTVEPRKISVRKPLADMKTFEKEAATFQVELSHADVEGVWLKDGIRLKPGSNIRISTSRRLHSLTLSELTLEDSGYITFNADGARSNACLTIKETPVMILRELQDVSIPESLGATFECELSRLNAEVKWYKEGEEIKPGKNYRIYSMGRRRIMQISKCRLEDSGAYTCDAGDCRTSARLQVLKLKLKLVKGLEDVDIRENDNAVFVCEVSQEDLKGEWFKNGEKIRPTSTIKIRQEGTKHFLLICNVRAEDAGEIKFVAKEIESTATLEVDELPIRIVKPLRDKTAFEKHRVILECKMSKPKARVRWYRGETEIFPSQKYEICNEDCYRKLIIHDVTFEDEDTYTCNAFDDQSSARLLVEEQAILVVRELQSVDVSAPEEARFECELSMPVIRPPQWSLNGEVLQNGAPGVRIESMGRVHRLILQQTTSAMSGLVKFTTGKARSKAQLTVRDT
ncbi:obscurin-like protein 1 [Latimeria chalumnae]|uniref:obscurin-like protein 1 n=1 Tax=Latimeria chalumnae TaxID=7897 RepID=UPI0003C19C82|nr:PREDICTED: obscurin-like protein 1 [Latimeria chalumnae]XP_014341474.1 PREDICTED: obscurin-like protein 1 [Latimeria chalumnae]|eukprot:XP_005991811.1 PREDICTED: obscurin-like protein 1 [Latimeria chalumnae]